MMAVARDSSEWRLPGCGPTCTVKYVFLPGLSGREPLEVHDPFLHEQYGQMLAEVGDGQTGWTIETGRMTVDLARMVVRVDGADVNLTATELKIVLYLARHLDSVRTYQQVVIDVWGAEWWTSGRGRGLSNPTHILRANLSRIRAKLGASGWLIHTQPGIGLRLLRLTPGATPSARPQFGRELPAGRWARDWIACRMCGTTDRPHSGRGVCESRRCRERFEREIVGAS